MPSTRAAIAPFVARANRKNAVGAGVAVQAAAADGFFEAVMVGHRLAQEDVDARVQHDVHAGRCCARL